jgi:hypothetical protein
MQPFSSPKNRHHGHGHGHGSFGSNSIRSWMNSTSFAERDSDTVDREHKIRIVEKLGQMKNALLDDQLAVNAPALSNMNPYSAFGGNPMTANIGSGNNTSKNLRLDSISMDTSTPLPTPYIDLSPSNAPSDAVVFMPQTDTTNAINTPSNPLQDGMEWLDDTQLSSLSNGELETMMDRYIMDVVKQLVTLATVDDELIAEIDSLDSNGYSLFHYCCAYNLISLIPVLLARGIEVNHIAADGSTGLHLAVGAGHFPIVQSLLESGAKVMVWNDQGVTPYDIAMQEGDEDMKALVTTYYQHEAQLQEQQDNIIRSPQVKPEDSINFLSSNKNAMSPTRSFAISSATNAPDNGSVPRSPHDSLTPGKVYHDQRQPTTPDFTNILSIQATPASTVNPTERDSFVSNKVFHEAFASLSLTDKCALSISMDQYQQQTAAIRSGTPKRLNSALFVGESGSSAIDSNTHMMVDMVMNAGAPSAALSASNEIGSLSFPFDTNAVLPSTTAPALATVSNGSGLFASINDEDISDIQSVISETDKESLGKAMSLMGHAELLQVEEEVKSFLFFMK